MEGGGDGGEGRGGGGGGGGENGGDGGAPPPQQVALLPTSEEAREMIGSLPAVQLEAARHAGALLVIADNKSAATPTPTSTAEAKATLREAMAAVANKTSLGGDALKEALALVVQYMRLSQHVNEGNGLPATIVSGKEGRSTARLYHVDSPDVPRYINTLLSAIARVGRRDVLTKTCCLDAERKLVVEHVELSFAAKTSCYRCDLSTAVLDELAADTALCAPVGTLRKLARFAVAAEPAAEAAEPAAQRQRCGAAPHDLP